MTETSLGGGSGAVAASAHSACARFRGTDPLITGRTRRVLAGEVGFPDDSGRIPEARWMRAMTFESLVKGPRFAGEVATTTVGRLGLDRPTEVVTIDAQADVGRTADALAAAHGHAARGAATLIHGLAVPFAGFEAESATPVLPDFAVVAPSPEGSWLVLGDSKDYERVRSRIEDTRLLKGFLQVALAAESAHVWSRLPAGMAVHSHGVLAAPRNAFLQPEALVDRLDDHRDEVRMRIAERRAEAATTVFDDADVAGFVQHLRATYDPASCTTCTFFSYCRHELRTSTDPADLLVELGVPVDRRRHVVGMVDGTGVTGPAPASLKAQIAASIDGVARDTGQRRVDLAGLPGTIDVAVVKSDAAALGVHGIAIRRVGWEGRGPWTTTVFTEPQSARTRRTVVELIGRELTAAMPDFDTVHLVVPDAPTADVLASIADNLAGLELSRLRWLRDTDAGREALTFNGEPATIPEPLTADARLAVSFLLEEDRARALSLRTPVVDVRAALARHLVAGGPEIASLRLDYLLAWAGTEPVDPRKVEDDIETRDHTPGARLGNRQSDAIHRALAGTRSRPADPDRYRELVRAELDYTCTVLDRALDRLGDVEASLLRPVHRAIEADAQAVWKRRLALHSSDLVRFGRTYRYWRNALVPVVESDDRCREQLLVLANPQTALDRATDAGTRDVATATVVSLHPLVLEVRSRRIGAGDRIVLLHVNGEACVERRGVAVKLQATNFSLTGLSIGPLRELPADGARPEPGGDRSGRGGAVAHLEWTPAVAPGLAVGDELIVATFAWFSTAKKDTALAIARPKTDSLAAPKAECDANSYDADPDAHAHCCRPHENAEAEWSDELAARRAAGELNPQVWPPVVDGDAFEVVAAGSPIGDATAVPSSPAPAELTMDDLE